MSQVRSWCPTLHEPMATGDGLLLRVKPPLGRIAAGSARVLAEAALRHGNGVVELTGRGSLQFRGFSAESAPLFAEIVLREGLAAADPAIERRRNVIVGLGRRVEPLAAALEIALAQAPGLAGLPAKFAFAVEAAMGDVRMFAEAGGCALVLEGGDVAAMVPLRQAAPAAMRVAAAFLALAEDERRMAALVERVGVGRVFEAADLVAKSAYRGRSAAPEGARPGFGVPFGWLRAPVFAELAGLAEDGVMRLLPWRAVGLAGADPAAIERLGLITTADDERWRVSACVGQPACASATVPTRDIAARMVPARGTTIHVSGCSKGCANPGAASLTFVGRDGRFDLVRDGRACDEPVVRGLAAAELAALR